MKIRNLNNEMNAKLALILLLIVTLCVVAGIEAATAQNWKVSSYLEKTFVSPKAGTSLGYEFPGNYEVGGFYQKAVMTNGKENLPRFYEEEFFGLYTSLPIRDTEKLDINFNIRTGVINNEIFAITPSLQAEFMPTKIIGLGLGVGIRNLRPTVITKIIVKLF